MINNNQIIIIVSIVVLVILTWMWINNYNQANAIAKIKKELLEAKKPSEIEIIQKDYLLSKERIVNDKLRLDEIEKELEMVKRSYEEWVWKNRCLEKNILLKAKGEKLENCDENLERFAVWNMGLN